MLENPKSTSVSAWKRIAWSVQMAVQMQRGADVA